MAAISCHISPFCQFVVGSTRNMYCLVSTQHTFNWWNSICYVIYKWNVCVVQMDKHLQCVWCFSNVFNQFFSFFFHCHEVLTRLTSNNDNRITIRHFNLHTHTFRRRFWLSEWSALCLLGLSFMLMNLMYYIRLAIFDQPIEMCIKMSLAKV